MRAFSQPSAIFCITSVILAKGSTPLSLHVSMMEHQGRAAIADTAFVQAGASAEAHRKRQARLLRRRLKIARVGKAVSKKN